jgi:hypothetical protein
MSEVKNEEKNIIILLSTRHGFSKEISTDSSTD